MPDEVKRKIYPKDQWTGSVKVFEEMIKYLYYNGFKTINTTEFYNWYIGKVEFKKKTVLITIDDGFYEDYYLIYPIIRKYNFKVTSFIVGNRVMEKTLPYNESIISFIGMDIINKVRKEYPYLEFQSHSFDMHSIVKTNNSKYVSSIYAMSYEELENDFFKNEKFGFTSMAYPYGNFNGNVKKILKNHGYLISFRFGPSKLATRNDDRFAISRIKLDGYANISTLKKWLIYI